MFTGGTEDLSEACVATSSGGLLGAAGRRAQDVAFIVRWRCSGLLSGWDSAGTMRPTATRRGAMRRGPREGVHDSGHSQAGWADVFRELAAFGGSPLKLLQGKYLDRYRARRWGWPVQQEPVAARQREGRETWPFIVKLHLSKT